MKNSIFLFMIIPLFLTAQNTHTELGDVQWIRDYDKALELSQKNNKPVFILFQEVPGCATCRNYGNNVLSDPIIVEMIEDLFIPLAIFNNKGGDDRKILQKYSEPSWNNPVVRIVNAKGEDISGRLAGNYSKAGVVDRMVKSYDILGKKIPTYADVIHRELNDQTEEAYYSMYCFWSGEAHFGNEDAVLSTEAGWMNGKEVVKVLYDPTEISKKDLDAHAVNGKCRSEQYNNNFRVDNTPQYYLENSPYAALDLTPAQRTKVNAALGSRQDPKKWLSPRQVASLNH